MTVNQLTETWLPVVGLGDLLEVSDLGNVRNAKTGRLRKPSPGNQYGHLYVTYMLDKKRCIQPVHRMVLDAFVGPRPDGMVCCHNNGDRGDNRLENLRWDTQRSNLLDAVSGGTHHWSKRSSCKNGHEYTLENTIWKDEAGKHWRLCRECARTRTRLCQQRRRAAAKGLAA